MGFPPPSAHSVLPGGRFLWRAFAPRTRYRYGQPLSPALLIDVLGADDLGVRRAAYDELVIVAPPKMLGFLREAMPDPLRKLVRREEAKDLTRLSPAELPERLRQLL